MNFTFLSCLLLSTTAVVPDTVKATYYAADPAIIVQAQDLLLQSVGTVNFAGQVFTDGRLTDAMELAALRGVSVNAVISPSGSGSKQTLQAEALVAAGGHVWTANVPNTMPNRFMTIDGGTTCTGTYKWSETAVQVGAYLTVLSGTNAASTDDAHFASLVASGTPVAWSPPLLDLQPLKVFIPCQCLTPSCPNSSGACSPPSPAKVGSACSPVNLDSGSSCESLHAFAAARESRQMNRHHRQLMRQERRHVIRSRRMSSSSCGK